MNNAIDRVHRVAMWLNRNTGFILLVVMILFGLAILGFQKDNQQLLEDTKNISENTQRIVTKQDETLRAIEQLALDSKISGDELKDILTCMLVVPIELRTDQVQQNCREQAKSNSRGAIQQQPANQTEQTEQPKEKKENTRGQPSQPNPVQTLGERITNISNKAQSFVKNLVGQE